MKASGVPSRIRSVDSPPPKLRKGTHSQNQVRNRRERQFVGVPEGKRNREEEIKIKKNKT